mgnify:CR=1 FL=1
MIEIQKTRGQTVSLFYIHEKMAVMDMKISVTVFLLLKMQFDIDKNEGRKTNNAKEKNQNANDVISFMYTDGIYIDSVRCYCSNILFEFSR